MGLVDEGFQLFGRAEAAAGGEERRHMVTEGTIVGVLLNGHDLDGIVASLGHAGQHVVLELCVAAHFLSILSHTDVALVDEQRTFLGLKAVFLPHIGLGRIPHLGRENLRLIVLHHAAAPCRNALAFTAVPLHLHLVELAVLQVLFLQTQLPVAGAFNALAAVVLVLGPVVEVADEIDVGSVRCPLAEHPSAVQLMQAEIEMAGGKVGEALLTIIGELTDFPECMVVTAADGVFIRLQIGIVLYECNMLRCFLLSLLGVFFLCSHKTME